MLFENRFYFILSFLFLSIVFSFCSSNSTTSSDSAIKTNKNDSLVIARLSSVSRTLPSDFIGFNANLIKGPSWSDTAFLNILKKFHPELIRFPGGTVANYWDWKNGWFVSDMDLPKVFSQRKPLHESLEDFAKAVKYVDAKPVFDLNMLTSDLQMQRQFLFKAQSLKLPIEYVEMGNEFYLGDKAHVQKFPDGHQYGLKTNDWIDSLKKAFPEAKYAIVGNGTPDIGKITLHSNRRNNWNRDLLSSEQNADAVTFHFYHGQMLKNQDMQSEIVYLRSHRKRQDSIMSGLSSDFSKSIQELFSHEQGLIDFSNRKIYQLPPNLEVWITESNTTDRDNSMRLNGTWLQGLYVANLFMQMIMQPRVSMLLFHQVSSTANFGAIFNDTGAFDGFDEPLPNKKFGISAAGYSMKLIMNAMNGMNKAVELSFSADDGLRGILFSNEKNTSLLLLNLSNAAETISMDSLSSSLTNVSSSQIAVNPLETITGFETNIEKSVLPENNRVSLPRYSLTVLFFKN